MSLITDMPTNVALLVDQCISDNKGDQLALRYREKRYSFNDLAALMNRAGNVLRRFNVETGDQIIVAVPSSPSLIASVLGAMKIGAAAVVMPNAVSPQILPKLTANGGPKLLIVEAARLPEFEAVKDKLKVLVVGEAGEGHSFLQEMRTSTSSLSRTLVPKDVPALAVADDGNLIWLTHDEISRANTAAGDHMPYVRSDIGKALARLARGEEVSIQ